MVDIPDRDNDSAEAFARQQAEIAKQVSAAKAAQLDKELRDLLKEEGK